MNPVTKSEHETKKKDCALSNWTGLIKKLITLDIHPRIKQ